MPQKTAKQPAEAMRKRLREILRRRTLPQGVNKIEFKFGEDSNGDPAIWILFMVNKDFDASTTKVSEISDLGDWLKSEILMTDSGYWPYVRVDVAA